LADLSAFTLPYKTSRVSDGAIEQGVIFRMEVIAILFLLAFGERSVGIEVILDIRSTPLYELCRQSLSMTFVLCS